jgi:hypothetical protein
MRNRLEICKSPDSDSNKPQKYTVTISPVDENAETFVSYLDTEYGIKSMNFVRGCGVQSMFWFKPTGSGYHHIKSCVDFRRSENEIVILFNEKIKSIIENEIGKFNNKVKLFNNY